MGSASNTFGSVTAGTAILIDHEGAVYYNLSGVFVGTIQLVKSTTGGNTWEILRTVTAPTSGRLVIDNPDRGRALVMWRCTVYTSGSAVTTLYDQAGYTASLLTAATSRLLVTTGDSITQGGNIGNQALTAAAFVGSGQVGTITGVIDSPVGSTIYIHEFNETEWNGTKTVATNTGSVITFVNDKPLAAAPSLASGFTTANIFYDASTNNRNFIKLANGMLNFPWGRIVNRAGSGRRVSHMLSHFQQDVLDLKPDDVFIMGGTNDIIAGSSAAVIFPILKTTVDMALAQGCRVIFGTLVPYADSTGTGTSGAPMTAARKELLLLNTLIRDYSRDTKNITLFDAFKSVVNPVNGDWSAGSSNISSDGTHPAVKGAWFMARELYNTLNASLGQRNRLINCQVNSYDVDSTSNQLFANPLQQGTGGVGDTGITDTDIADGNYIHRYAGTPSATCTVVARSAADTYGNDQVITVTSAANLDQLETRLGTSLHARVTAGQQVKMRASYSQASVPANTLGAMQLFFTVTAGGVTTQVYAANGTGTTAADADCDNVGYETEWFTIPASCTALQLYWRQVFKGTGTNSIFKIGQIEVYKRTV